MLLVLQQGGRGRVRGREGEGIAPQHVGGAEGQLQGHALHGGHGGELQG